MQYIVKIDVDNSAFDGLPGYELARILRELADDMGTYGAAISRSVQDFNGNTVGKAELAEGTCYGWTNWDTREASGIIGSIESWHLEARELHVDGLREEFGPRVEEFTAGTDSEIDPSAVNWLEVYGALHDL